MDSLWFLFLGHILGDYAFQSDAMAKQKGSSPRLLVLHIAIYSLTLALTYIIGLYLVGRPMELTPTPFIAFAGILIVHGLQDGIKVRFFSCSRQAYYIDQALHIIQLYILRLWLG